MKILREADATIKIYDDFRCDVCRYKFKSGDKFRAFINNDIDEFCDDKELDRRYVFEVKKFHTIHNTYSINICENCFKPKIYKEVKDDKKRKTEKERNKSNKENFYSYSDSGN